MSEVTVHADRCRRIYQRSAAVGLIPEISPEFLAVTCPHATVLDLIESLIEKLEDRQLCMCGDRRSEHEAGAGYCLTCKALEGIQLFEPCKAFRMLEERKRAAPVAAARRELEPCGCFKGLTVDGDGCQRPKGHEGECRPYHGADPGEWATATSDYILRVVRSAAPFADLPQSPKRDAALDRWKADGGR